MKFCPVTGAPCDRPSVYGGQCSTGHCEVKFMIEKLKGKEMTTGIDPKYDEIFVRRVNNGWIVYRRSLMSGDMAEAGFVARTPKELADLIAEWATKQQDQPMPKP